MRTPESRNSRSCATGKLDRRSRRPTTMRLGRYRSTTSRRSEIAPSRFPVGGVESSRNPKGVNPFSGCASRWLAISRSTGESPRKIRVSDGILRSSTRKTMRQASYAAIVSALPAIIGPAGTTSCRSFKYPRIASVKNAVPATTPTCCSSSLGRSPRLLYKSWK